MFEIKIKTSFSAYHSVMMNDGDSEPLHLHTFKITFTVGRKVLDQYNWVIDFGLANELIGGVISQWQGKVLNELPQFVEHPPTVERMAYELYRALSHSFAEHRCVLRKVKVYEDDMCAAIFQGE